ncbi:MAG: hypothetical protein RL166_252, partial [Actinomycetota bacterium]
QAPTIVSGSEPTLNNITLTQDVATVNTGTWQAEPAPTFTYKWMLCGAGTPAQVTSSSTPSGCTVLSGNNITSTSSSIVVPTLGGKNLERYLVVQVIASNRPYVFNPFSVAESRASSTSIALKEKPYFASTDPVSMTSSPTTSVFAPNVGETITMVNDQTKWSSTPVESSGLVFAYSWYTCGLNYQSLQRTELINNDCVLIPNETGKSITLTRALAGSRVLGKISATSNDSGWGSSVTGYATTATPQVKEKPYSITPPSQSVATGTQPQVGVKISGSPGDWGGFPQPQVDSNVYQWYMCNDEVEASSTLQAGCSLITTPTSNSSYTPSSSQAGKYIVFSALVSNTVNPTIYSTDRQFSAGFGPTLMAPEITFATPAFTGTAHVGQTLTTAMPTVKAYPNATSTSFEWYHCANNSGVDSNTSVPANCTKIGDTNQTSITVDDSMAGRFIEIYAVSTNSVKTVRKNTFSSRFVTKSPTNDVAPTISGVAEANGTNRFTATAGRWSAVPAVSNYGYTWFLCTANVPVATTTKPSSCAASGVSATTSAPTQLLLTRNMAGKYLVLEESATQASNNIDSNKVAKIYSASSMEITSSPLFESDSTLTGFRHVGEELTATVGTITGYPTPTPTIQWHSCTSPVTSKLSLVGFGCSPISGANASRYTLTSSEFDRYVTYSVSATNSAGTSVSVAVSGSLKVTQTPTSTSPLTIRGDTVVGANKVITATTGTWVGTATISKTFNWYYCNTQKTSAVESLDSDCTQVTSSGGIAVSSSSLTLTADFRGKHIVAVEIATNTSNKPGAGRGQMVSASMGPINMAPVFETVPSIGGVMHVGETLTASLPTVTASPSATRTYEWWSCSSALNASAGSMPASCVALTGLGNNDLIVTSELAGRYIALAVTAANDFGTVLRSSTAVTDVTQSPSNSAAAVITGSPVVGATTPLAVTTGTWTSAPQATAGDYSYLWYQCSQNHSSVPSTLPADCALISGQSASTLLPTNAMAGKYLLAKVTLAVRSNKSGGGSASIFTASTQSVRNKPSFGAASPTINGVAHLGETLTATMTSTAGNETPSTSYQWWSCDSSVVAGATDITANCSAIAGSENAALVVGSGLVGKRIAVLQTATNNQGSATKSSSTTVPVSSTPSNTAAPVVSGSDVFSSTTSRVTSTTGSWTGFPAPAATDFSYQWYSCNSSETAASLRGDSCSLISGATASSLDLTNAFVGKHLVARVTARTATNKVGAESAATFSASFGPIRVAPTNTVAPSFSPTSVIAGRTITANVGTWTGTGPITTEYKWYTCPTTATISVSAPIPANCTLIANFDNSSLVVPATAATKKLLLVVTATNSAGSTVRSVISSAAVAAASIVPLALRAII